MTTTFSTEIEVRSTIPMLVEAWEEGIADIKEGYRLLAKGQARIHGAFSGDPAESAYAFRVMEDGSNIDDKCASRILELKKEAWRRLINRLQLRNIMSIARIKELDDQLEQRHTWNNKCEPLPEITQANLFAMLETNLSRMDEYLKEKVFEVYEWLRPHKNWGDRYVTNANSLEAGIGKKLIKGWVIERAYSGGGYHVTYNSRDQVLHMDQVFHMLDGQQMPDLKTHDGELCNAIAEQTKVPGVNTAETPYFKVKCFANRNLHIEFKRQDLLDKFNLMAAGMLLKKGKNE